MTQCNLISTRMMGYLRLMMWMRPSIIFIDYQRKGGFHDLTAVIKIAR